MDYNFYKKKYKPAFLSFKYCLDNFNFVIELRVLHLNLCNFQLFMSSSFG